MSPQVGSGASVLSCIIPLLAASGYDVALRKIPHWTVLTLVVLGLVMRFADGSLLSGTLTAVAIFLGCTLCWYRGWLGGGDVKLLAAAALNVPPLAALDLVSSVALSGGVLAVLYLVARHVIPVPRSASPGTLLRRVLRVECWRINRGAPLPYACAITIGTLIVLLRESV